MALALAFTVLGVVVIVFIVLVARERAPAPDDVAVAYERAWDRLDFETLWYLSGPELRDGRDRKAFVAAKRAAYPDRQLAGLVRDVTASTIAVEPDSAIVVTELVTDEGAPLRNRCTLARRTGRWFVIAHGAA